MSADATRMNADECGGEAMGARENILARIRKAQGRSGARADRGGDRAGARGESRGTRSGRSRLSRTRRTGWRSSARNASGWARRMRRWPSEKDIAAEVARYLAANGLGPRLAGWREFAGLDWAGAGLAFDDRPGERGDDATGLTGCFCAIAETGTVLLLSSPATPKVTALLPETHICVVRTARMLDTMEDSFALLRSEVGDPPRAVFFVSGPSRTADIEQTIVIGAHGPYRVHIVLADMTRSWPAFLAAFATPAFAARGIRPRARDAGPVPARLHPVRPASSSAIALFHHYTFQVAVTGLVVIALYKALVTGTPYGTGLAGLAGVFGHEWVHAREPLLPAHGVRAALQALRGLARSPRCCRASCRTTGRAASCCS